MLGCACGRLGSAAIVLSGCACPDTGSVALAVPEGILEAMILREDSGLSVMGGVWIDHLS